MRIIDDFHLPRPDQSLLVGLREAHSPMLERIDSFGEDTARLYVLEVERPRQLPAERLESEDMPVATASELATQLALFEADRPRRLRVVADTFTWDAPLLLRDKRSPHRLVVDFSAVGAHEFGDFEAALISLESCTNVGVCALKLLGCPAGGVSLLDCEDFSVADCVFVGCKGTPIEASGRGGLVENNYFRACTPGAIVLHSGAERVTVRDNHVEQCCESPMQGAIVVTQRRRLAGVPVFQGREWTAAIAPMDDSGCRPPRGVAVVGNRVLNCRAVSIVIDGAIDVTVAQNELRWGRCEGLVVAGGTVGCRIAENVIADCGLPAPADDADPARRSEGSAAYAAVMLSNVVMSSLIANLLLRPGASAVSASGDVHACLLGLNTIIQTPGAPVPPGSSGLYLGDDQYPARSGVRRPDGGHGHYSHNLLFGNIIRGPFRTGITLGAGCRANHLFDNTIFQTTQWSIESIDQQRDNVALNNLSAVRSRNIAVTENMKMLVADMDYDLLEGQ